MSSRDRWITRHLRRLHFGQFLQRSGEWLAGFLFLYGTLILVTRVLLPQMWPDVLWAGLLAIPALVGAWLMGRRQPFTRQESIALLDRSLHAGGLLMTLSERSDEEWDARLPQLERMWQEAMPRIRPRRLASFLTMPAVFTICVLFVPLSEIRSATTQLNTAGQDAAHDLEAILDSLREAEVLDEDEEDELREEIERLAREAEDTPLTHERWEAVDALERRMRLRLDESVAMAQQAEAASQLLASATEGESGLTAERREQLEQQVMEALQQLAANGGLEGASQMLQQAAQSGQLPSDPQARQQALQELAERLQRESERLSQLRSQCQGNCRGGQCPGGKPGDCEGDGKDGEDGDGNPGRGGVNRGRGDAEISFGDESDEQGAQFRETVLPPGFMDDAESMGFSLTAPQIDAADTAARSESRLADPASGMETWQRTVRPRHRSVVRQFFDSGESETE